MNIEEEIFKKAKLNFNNLAKYGFKKEKQKYVYEKNIMKNLKVQIVINNKGILNGKIYDLNTNEEYTLFRKSEELGEFASNIKNEYINILKNILANCYERKCFLFEQSNRITNYIKEEYKVEPEFLWESTLGAGVFRNESSKKWFGIIMNVNRGKLDKGAAGEIEVLNVKLDENIITNLLKEKGFFPAYHMNKKSWISIILDDKVSDKKIISCINMSYNNTK